MDAHAAVFWAFLFVGLPGALMLWTHRSDSAQRRAFLPVTSLILIGLGITSTGSTGQQAIIVAEVGLFTIFVTGILSMGVYLMVFGGATPVGPVPRGWRSTGKLLMISGLASVGLLVTGPEWLPLQAPQGWSSFVASGIVGLVSASIFGFVIVWMYGDGRWITLTALVVISSIGLVGAMLWIESGAISMTEISNSFTTAIGSLLGIILAVLLAVGLMVQIESGATVPQTSRPLTNEEIEKMNAIIQANLGGQEE